MNLRTKNVKSEETLLQSDEVANPQTKEQNHQGLKTNLTSDVKNLPLGAQNPLFATSKFPEGA